MTWAELGIRRTSCLRAESSERQNRITHTHRNHSYAESTTCNPLQPSRKDTPSPRLCYSANHVILRRGSVPLSTPPAPRCAPDYPTFHCHTHKQLLITSSTLPKLQTFSAKFALAIQKINPPLHTARPAIRFDTPGSSTHELSTSVRVVQLEHCDLFTTKTILYGTTEASTYFELRSSTNSWPLSLPQLRWHAQRGTHLTSWRGFNTLHLLGSQMVFPQSQNGWSACCDLCYPWTTLTLHPEHPSKKTIGNTGLNLGEAKKRLLAWKTVRNARSF